MKNPDIIVLSSSIVRLMGELSGLKTQLRANLSYCNEALSIVSQVLAAQGTELDEEMRAQIDGSDPVCRRLQESRQAGYPPDGLGKWPPPAEDLRIIARRLELYGILRRQFLAEAQKLDDSLLRAALQG